MPTEEAMLTAFLDDIVAHPEDPSLWLILADWLDERDDPRTELVRQSWSLLHEPHHPEFEQREARVQELISDGTIPVVPQLKLGEFEFSWIAPGSFLMGSPQDEAEREDNEGQHPVTISRGFWLGTHLVTQGQWKDWMPTNRSGFTRDGEYSDRVERLSDAEIERLPVEGMSHAEALEFCQKLKQKFRQPVRLPTEAEWELACRAGTTTPFHFGSILNGHQANCDGTMPYGTREQGPYAYRTVPVGLYPPNPHGLYDLHGNVREWCQDLYLRELHELPEVDPVSTTGDGHVARGECWIANAAWCRVAYRVTPSSRTGDSLTGFRLCI